MNYLIEKLNATIQFCATKLVNISITLMKSEENLTIFICEKTYSNYSAAI